jgi:tripartite-type tricarboxylate transporter receptor subunit TctC
MLVVPPSLPVKSVKDLIVLAKARPGELNYVSTSTGGSLHLAAELLKAMAGVNIVRVTYKGSATAMPDLMSGQVHMAIMGIGAAIPHVKSGKLRGLAVSGLKPSPLAPGLPPIAATLPGYEAVGVTAVMGPRGMPSPIVTRLNQEIARALAQAEITKKLLDFSQETVGGPPETLGSAMKSDMAKWSKLIKDAGIKSE